MKRFKRITCGLLSLMLLAGAVSGCTQYESGNEKVYTYEEVRAILAEKSRTGFRAEVKAILTGHGVKQLSDVKDPAMLAKIVAEAESIATSQT